jgi:hypothetical protein
MVDMTPCSAAGEDYGIMLFFVDFAAGMALPCLLRPNAWLGSPCLELQQQVSQQPCLE